VKPGEPIDLEVVRDVQVGPLLVIPRHTKVIGTVTSVQPARRAMRGGLLAIQPGAVTAITGETIALKGNRGAQGGPSTDQKARAVMEGYIIFSWVPLLFKGDEALLPKGTALDAFITSDVSFDTARLREAAAVLEQQNAAARVAARTGKASVYLYGKRYTGKCTIALDGNPLVRLSRERFLKLQLVPGAHTFRCQDHELSIDAQPDQDYYIRVDGHPGFWTTRDIPVSVPADQGEDEIYPLGPVDSKDVLDTKLGAGGSIP